MSAFLTALQALGGPIVALAVIAGAAFGLIGALSWWERRHQPAYTAAQARWDAHVEAALLAAEAPIYDAMALERLRAELDDDDALRRWLA